MLSARDKKNIQRKISHTIVSRTSREKKTQQEIGKEIGYNKQRMCLLANATRPYSPLIAPLEQLMVFAKLSKMTMPEFIAYLFGVRYDDIVGLKSEERDMLKNLEKIAPEIKDAFMKEAMRKMPATTTPNNRLEAMLKIIAATENLSTQKINKIAKNIDKLLFL